MPITQEMEPSTSKGFVGISLVQKRVASILASASESNQDLVTYFSQNKYGRITQTWTWCWNLTQILEDNPGKWNLDMGVQLTPKKKIATYSRKHFV